MNADLIFQKDNKLWVEAYPIMLPTEKASHLYIINGNRLYFDVRKVNNTKEVPNQHLYFLSDEEIKEGDWMLNTSTKEIRKCFSIDEKSRLVYTENDKKIIASTDDLGVDLGYVCLDLLPRPSNEFLQEYCKADGKIYKCLVEVVEQWSGKDINPTYHLKIADDNTITIEEIVEQINYVKQGEAENAKDFRLYTREEVEMLIVNSNTDFLTNQLMNKPFDIKEWIEENL